MAHWQGGCLCGAVRFDYDGEIGGALGAITICHCSTCRRAQGYASAVAPLSAAALHWQSGTDQIAEYESSPGKYRAFCRTCGTPLYSRRTTQPDVLRLRLGALDGSDAVAAEAHIYATGLPDWARIGDDGLSQYDELEPARAPSA